MKTLWKWNDQHVTSVGQKKNLRPRQYLNTPGERSIHFSYIELIESEANTENNVGKICSQVKPKFLFCLLWKIRAKKQSKFWIKKKGEYRINLNFYLQHNLTPASQVEVGCPWARGLQPQYTPRRKNTHRPTNPQPSHEPPRAQPPTIAPVTLRPEAQWK